MHFRQYLFIYFKTLGLAPMAINKRTTQKRETINRIFEYSYVGLIYDVILISILIVFLLYRIYFFPVSLDDKTKMSLVTGTISIFVDCAAATVVLLTFIVNQESAVEIGNKLYFIYMNLKILNLKFEKRWNQKHLILTILCYIILWSSIITIGILRKMKYQNMICGYLPNIIIHSLILQYLSILISIHDAVYMINKDFQNFSKAYFSETGNYIIQKTPSNNFSPFQRLILLREQCLCLYEISHGVSYFYAYTILACICKLYYCLVFDIYFVIKPSILGKNIVLSALDVWTICYITLAIFSIVILTKYVTKTVKEVSIACFMKCSLIYTF